MVTGFFTGGNGREDRVDRGAQAVGAHEDASLIMAGRGVQPVGIGGGYELRLRGKGHQVGRRGEVVARGRQGVGEVQRGAASVDTQVECTRPMDLALIALAIVIFEFAALRWGYDSRDL